MAATKATKSSAKKSSVSIDLANVVETVKSVILTPTQALPKLLAQKKTLNELIVLTAIVAVPTLVGALVAGFALYGLGASFAIQYAILAYVGSVAVPILAVLILDFLDPSLSNLKYTREGWGKIVVYTSIPYLVAGAVQIIPFWGIQWLQSLAGLYGLYLFYFTLTKIKKVPQDKVIALILIYIVVLGVLSWTVYGYLVTNMAWSATWGSWRPPLY
jgi:uncharacterized protein with PQ loop repeat